MESKHTKHAHMVFSDGVFFNIQVRNDAECAPHTSYSLLYKKFHVRIHCVQAYKFLLGFVCLKIQEPLPNNCLHPSLPR